MSDLRISYEEEMVGSGHPTKADTLNRLFLGGPSATLRDTDGKVLYNLFKERTADPSTGAGEGALFAKQNSSGVLALHWRRPGDGEVVELAPRLRAVETGTHTPSWTSSYYSYISLATSGLDASRHLPLLHTTIINQAGFGWWWKLDVANSRIVVTRGNSSQGPADIRWSLLEVPSGYTLEQGESAVACGSSAWAGTNISLAHDLSAESLLLLLMQGGQILSTDQFTTNSNRAWGVRLDKHASDADKLVGHGWSSDGTTTFNNFNWAVITP
jgi:hypothetical protein